MKYVEYGKIYGNPDPDGCFSECYRWLSNYCGYFPQVWLSRSHSRITGIRSCRDQVLFGFDVIRGFPLNYDWWCYMLSPIMKAVYGGLDPIRDIGAINEILFGEVKRVYRSWPDEFSGDPHDSETVDDWLEKHVFVKHDQVVVPSLNLKAAKEVFCGSEKEKKKLRKLGFIEDRIKIRKFPNPWG